MANQVSKTIIITIICTLFPFSASAYEGEEREYASAQNLCYEIANTRATDARSWQLIVERCLIDRGFKNKLIANDRSSY